MKWVKTTWPLAGELAALLDHGPGELGDYTILIDQESGTALVGLAEAVEVSAPVVAKAEAVAEVQADDTNFTEYAGVF